VPNPVTIPDENNDAILSSAQKDSILYQMDAQFDAFIGNVQMSGYQSDMAEAICDLLEGFIKHFGPYLAGAVKKPGQLKPENVNGGSGFKGKMSDELKEVIKETKLKKAGIAEDVESFYCPSTRTWVKNPADCPDLDE